MEIMVGEMVQLLKNNYSGKRIFLTGHTGFKGSWLTALLHHLGAEVKGYALAPKNEKDHYNIIDGDEICHSEIRDIRDLDGLKSSLQTFDPHYVFHLAAQPLVIDSYLDPVYTYAVNVMGTAHVLEAMRGLEGACIGILITTDKVYKNHEWEYPYRECDELGGFDPYSNSKACSELVIDSYRSSFFNPSKLDEHQKKIASARAGNVIGGGDWSDNRLVPDIVKSVHVNEEVVLRNPDSVRPWQHVLEPLVGYLVLGARMNEDDESSFSEAWNFGPDNMERISVGALTDLAQTYWGRSEREVRLTKAMHHEAGLLKLDISKAKSLLGWYPVLSQKDSIKWTIDWYKHYLNKTKSARDLTTNQIKAYLDLL